MGNKLKLILFLSLSINLLLVGVVIGYSVRGCKRHGRPVGPPEFISQKLSPEKQELFTKALRSLHEKNRKNHRAIQKKREEVVAILVASKFDPQAYQKASAELHELHGQMKDALTQTVMELAVQLNPEERKALAQFLRQGPPPGKHRGGSRGGRDQFRQGRPPHHRPPHGGRHGPGGPPPGGPGGGDFPGGPPSDGGPPQ